MKRGEVKYESPFLTDCNTLHMRSCVHANVFGEAVQKSECH